MRACVCVCVCVCMREREGGREGVSELGMDGTKREIDLVFKLD